LIVFAKTINKKLNVCDKSLLLNTRWKGFVIKILDDKGLLLKY
jgi:hypothetical protein